MSSNTLDIEKFRSSVTSESIQSLYASLTAKGEGKIYLNAPYQRDIVWDEDKKSEFITSIYRNIIPTNLIFNIDEENNMRICLDGKQRCSSIIDFISGKIPLYKDGVSYYYSDNNEKKGNKTSKKNIISATERSEFLYKVIPIVTYKGLSYDDQLEVFARIQYGHPLTEGEKISTRFKNDEIYAYLSEFFDSFVGNKKLEKHISTNRKNHHKFLLDIMFLLYYDIKPFNAQNFDTFTNKLNSDLELVKKLKKKIKPLIEMSFGNDILNHRYIQDLKLRKILRLIYIYFLSKKNCANIKNSILRQTLVNAKKCLDDDKILYNSPKKIYNCLENEYKKLVKSNKYLDESSENSSDSDNDSDNDSDSDDSSDNDDLVLSNKYKKICKK